MANKNDPAEAVNRGTELAQAPAEAGPQEDVSRAQIWAFWGIVALAVVTARALNYMLPGISESVIERWVMLGFGACMGLFLLKLK